jgi:membrane-bound lytic murein transglycosylase B
MPIIATLACTAGRLRSRRWLALALLALAAPAAAIEIEQYPELDGFIESMVTRHKFERATLTRWFKEAEFRQDIIAAMERPREAKPWHEYRAIFINEERVRLGLRYWQQHEDTLARAEQKYGVPPEIVIAILGVETSYGKHKGQFSAFEALLTLTFGYPRRSAFFKRELEELLLLARELKVDPRTIDGSYAGALGIPQFMPSSYRQYAVDFDKNGRRELGTSHDDTIGSVANFLGRHGWRHGQPVAEAARADGTLHAWLGDLGTRPSVPVRQWASYGIFPQREPHVSAVIANDDERLAALIVLEGENGPVYHLGYENFYVITRYNRSKNYAMAVVELGRTMRTKRLGKDDLLQTQRE